jgi:hypothetical protein
MCFGLEFMGALILFVFLWVYWSLFLSTTRLVRSSLMEPVFFWMSLSVDWNDNGTARYIQMLQVQQVSSVVSELVAGLLTLT